MAESWATEQELAFLKNLGTYREAKDVAPVRLKLLENDLKAARERVDWGTVNGDKIIQFAEDQVAAERLKTE